VLDGGKYASAHEGTCYPLQIKGMSHIKTDISKQPHGIMEMKLYMIYDGDSFPHFLRTS